jgi:hypothetical protein
MILMRHSAASILDLPIQVHVAHITQRGAPHLLQKAPIPRLAQMTDHVCRTTIVPTVNMCVAMATVKCRTNVRLLRLRHPTQTSTAATKAVVSRSNQLRNAWHALIVFTISSSGWHSLFFVSCFLALFSGSSCKHFVETLAGARLLPYHLAISMPPVTACTA